VVSEFWLGFALGIGVGAMGGVLALTLIAMVHKDKAQ
jgi:hypothetical protein